MIKLFICKNWKNSKSKESIKSNYLHSFSQSWSTLVSTVHLNCDLSNVSRIFVTFWNNSVPRLLVIYNKYLFNYL